MVNFFVGGMVGTERTVTPLVGSAEFHLGAIAISAFVVVFGFTKAIPNAVGGAVTARYPRKFILVAGWLIGLPVPFMLAWGAQLGLGDRRQCPARRQLGPDLADDGQHEDRPDRPWPPGRPAWHQLDRRLPRRSPQPACDRCVA